MTGAAAQYLAWPRLLRIALVQTAIGAIVVLATSTLNRIMVVELALPATVPAALVALHYLVQLLRPHHGYRVDVAGRSTGRILGGMAVLAAGGLAAALAVTWIRTQPVAGWTLAIVAYVAVGVGVGAAGTANLSLLSKSVSPQRRSIVAAVVWIMMILGFSLSAGIAGHFLRPYSPARLLEVFALASVAAFALAWLALAGIELPAAAAATAARQAPDGGFMPALRQLFADRAVRCFTAFLFVSMLAFSAQELLLEPFGGLVFQMPPSATAQLAGLQNGGVVAGMLALVIASLLRRRQGAGVGLAWMTAGTVGSALALSVLAVLAARESAALLSPAVFVLGLANGVFAVSALGVMMELGTAGARGTEGLRMGVWGAAQALAFAVGGLLAGATVDLARHWLGGASGAYALVFCLDALLFLVAATWAVRLAGTRHAPVAPMLAPASPEVRA